MKNKIKSFILGAGMLLGASYVQGLTQEQAQLLMEENPVIEHYVSNEDSQANNELGSAVEPLVNALAQKYELEHVIDGAYTTDDHQVLNQIRENEETLSNYTGGLTRPEISQIQNLAREYAQTFLDSEPVVEEEELPGTRARREIAPEDRWNAVLQARTIDDVVGVVGSGAVALAQLPEAQRSRLTSSQYDEVSRRVHAAAAYSVLDNATKGLEGYTPENVAGWLQQIGVSYFESIGNEDAAQAYLGNLPTDAKYDLARALSIGSREIADRASEVYGESDIPQFQDLEKLLKNTNNMNQASNYINSEWGVELTRPFRTNGTNRFSVDKVANGEFSGEFDKFTNYPNLELTLADLVRVGINYSGSSGSVYFQEDGEDSPSRIDNYTVNQDNFELSGLVNVLGFMQESNQFNLGLWLGAGYRRRAFTQEFNGEVIPRSENVENSFGLNAQLEGQYNTTTGTLLGAETYIKTGLSTLQDKTNVTGGVNLNLRQFLDGFYFGLNAGLEGSNDPVNFNANPIGGIELGTIVGRSYVGFQTNLSRNGLELGLDFKY